MIKDSYYIKTYDKIGHQYFCKGSDQQLKEWGNSEKDIKEMKIFCVKNELKFYENNINVYKILNKLNGGKNCL